MEMRPPVSFLTLTLAFALAVLVAGFLYWHGSFREVRCEGCNVILITLDAVGANHLGLYGYERDTSPALDRFFGERGIVWENAFSAAPWTLPSHAALFASRYPSELNVEFREDRLPGDVPLLPEIFQRAGWRTLGLGGGGFVRAAWGFARGFDRFFEEGSWLDAKEHLPALLDSLDDDSAPFFLFIHAFQIHDAFDAPAPYDALFGDGRPSRRIGIAEIAAANRAGYSRSTKEEFERAYDQEIRYTDAFFAELLAALESKGILDATIIAVVADHGEEFGEHGSVGLHAHTLYDELIRVPLLLYVPHTAPGRIKSEVASAIDVAPTLLDLAGLEVPSSFGGLSLRGVLSGTVGGRAAAISETAHTRASVLERIEENYEEILALVPRARTEAAGGVTRSVSSESAKIISNADGSFELYDLAADPGERRNLWNGLLEVD